MNLQKKINRKSRHAVRRIAMGFLDAFFFLLVIAFAYFVRAYFKAPIAATLLKRTVPLTTVIYDRSGEHVLYEIYGEENRKIVPHDQIPDTMKIATIAAEDNSFYKHYGIDPASLIRAILTNIKNRNFSQGGSTITQQLARNAFLTREKTFRRKFQEAILAIKIEKKFTKDQILDMYLNQIPYGSNTYGIGAAAEKFFGKEAKDLTLDEAALLAALPKATTYYSPYGTNQAYLVARQKGILTRIAALGLADYRSVNEAKKIDIFAKLAPFQEKIDAPHFVMFVKDELERKYGKQKVEEGGLKVYTTLDYDMQKLAETVVQKESVSNLHAYGATNASLVALDPRNGEILAMVGSLDYFDESIDGQVNVALRPRQPGSSFKPFAYAKAFEKGYQPETLVLDTKTNFGPDGSGHPYIPQNYDGKFHGLLTMRQALAGSLNIPAVKTLSAAGIDDTIELAHRLGITTLNDRQRYGLSLVLGGGEVKLLDMASGFSVFANDGKRNPSTPILKVLDFKGNILESNQPQNIPVLDPQVARKIDSILSDNAARVPIFGPRNRLFIPGRTVAAKTGTTQEFRDAWTIGFTPYLSVGVWAGNNDNHAMSAGADGSFVAAPIWNSFMTKAIQNLPDQKFIAYDKMSGFGQQAGDANGVKVTYFRNGRKISEKKANKADPKKVEVHFESLPMSATTSPFMLSETPGSSNQISLQDWKKVLK
ncbi:MAG TPA: PBP1A family penicillin-binding protein [Patescibacteria group bacterium]